MFIYYAFCFFVMYAPTLTIIADTNIATVVNMFVSPVFGVACAIEDDGVDGVAGVVDAGATGVAVIFLYT